MSEKAKEAAPRRGLDTDLQLMAKLDKLFAEVEDKGARTRALDWLNEKYGQKFDAETYLAHIARHLVVPKVKEMPNGE